MSKQQAKVECKVTALVRVNGALGSFGRERFVLELSDPNDQTEIIAALRVAGWETNAIENVTPHASL